MGDGLSFRRYQSGSEKQMDAMERLLGVLRRLSITAVIAAMFLFCIVIVRQAADDGESTGHQLALMLASLMLAAAGIGIVNWIFTGHWEPKKSKQRKFTEDPE